MTKLTLRERAARISSTNAFLNSLKITDAFENLPKGRIYTVFIPENNAWEKVIKNPSYLPPAGLERLKTLLLNHIVMEKYDALDLEQAAKLETASGKKLWVAENEGDIYVNGAKIITEDIDACDGIIHITNEVLTD